MPTYSEANGLWLLTAGVALWFAIGFFVKHWLSWAADDLKVSWDVRDGFKVCYWLFWLSMAAAVVTANVPRILSN